ncbi:MAG: sugar ABC transporter permease [Clostridiales bacterium]|nr:sugar ABC transporter permease [Clostridiales bacterium]
MAEFGTVGRKSKGKRLLHNILTSWEIYVLLLPTLVYYIIFAYLPMYGIRIAFTDFNPILGIEGSPWVGLKHFKRFLESPFFWQVIRNTLRISIYSIAASFPLAIILALILNYQRNMAFKRIVQTISYAPHFISTVVMVGMLQIFCSYDGGLFNIVREMLGAEPINFFGVAALFDHLYVWSGVWQGLGWSAIIYISALSSISPELHEAAIVDGANIWKRIWYIDLPGIAPTVITMFILNSGSVLSVGFEKIYLMQNAQNSTVSEVISTYVYKQGLLKTQYSYSAAVGLFNSVVNFVVLLIVNTIANKINDTSLF